MQTLKTPTLPSLYDFKGHNIRVVQIDNNLWFVAADVCKALGLTNVTKAVLGLVAEDLTLTSIQGQRGLPVRTVSEAGLYTLVMRSDKVEAKAFQDWVTGTVLPAIRKDGGYVMGEEKVVTGEMSVTKQIDEKTDLVGSARPFRQRSPTSPAPA